jgi:hypothetical protein
VAVWDIYDRPSEPDIRETRFNRYTMKGDTVINGKSYNKIYCSTYVYLNPPPKLTITNLGYCFGIRQDIATKRVYRTYDVNNTTIDTLLYDFDLKIGDTVTRSFTTRSGNQDQVVISIDSITYSGKKYKRFHLKGTMPDAALIEGVGSTNGLTEYNEGSFESAFLLDKFCNSDHSDCSEPLALAIQFIKADHTFTVFPNPFTTQLTVSFENEFAHRKVILTDLLGKEVLAFENVGKQLTIQKDGLTPGIYLLKVLDEKGLFTEKVVVQ